MLIRPAIPDDIPSMRALEQQAETAAHWEAREYEALFAADAPARIALAAVEDVDATKLHGFVIARCASNEWEIENLVVARDCQRLGTGSRLIRELLVRANIAGATSVLLEVRESNLAACRLYEKLGFSKQAKRRNYYRDPAEDALVLKISLLAGQKVP